MGRAPVIPVILIGVGGYLAWFGIHYWRRDVKWPSDPVKSVLTGKGPPDPGTAPATYESVLSQSEQAVQSNPNSVQGQQTPGGPGNSGAVGVTTDHAGLEKLWTSNGGNPATANIAAAIAEAESAGQPQATSANPDGGTNVGLWQLDTPGGKGAGYSVSQLQDPNTNARVTIMGTVNGTDWSAWQTYAQGTYRQYLK